MLNTRPRGLGTWRFSLLGTCILSVSLVACSSGSHTSSPTNSGSQSTPGASVSSSNPIKIGLIADIKTAEYDGSPNVTAVRAGVRGINARGGIDGREVQLDVCNGNINPNTTAACARQLVSDGVVATVFTLSVAGVGGQVASILGAAGIPQVGPAAITPPEFAATNNYVVAGGPPYDFGCMAGTGVKLGLTKQIDLQSAGQAGEAQWIASANQAVKNSGGTIVGTVTMPVSAADFLPYAQAIANKGAQGVIGSISVTAFEQVSRALRGLGSKATMEVNSGSVNPADFSSLSSFIDGTIICQPFPPQSAIAQFPLLSTLKSDMAAENAAGDNATTFENMSGNAEWAWWDVEAFADAAKLIKGTVNAASLTQELNTVQNLNVGLIPPWTPSKQGPAGFARVSNPYEYATKIENGTLQLISPTPVDSAALIQGS